MISWEVYIDIVGPQEVSLWNVPNGILGSVVYIC